MIVQGVGLQCKDAVRHTIFLFIFKRILFFVQGNSVNKRELFLALLECDYTCLTLLVNPVHGGLSGSILLSVSSERKVNAHILNTQPI